MVCKNNVRRRLKHKIIIEEPTRTQNAYGEPVESFTTYASRKCDIMTTIGRENFNKFQEFNEYPVVFKVRYDSLTKNISEKMRVLYNSRYYDVEGVVNYNEQNIEIHIYGKNRGS